MNHNTPLSPRPVRQIPAARRQVMTARALREHGVPTTAANERCRPGGPWQMPLPGVYVLHSGPLTSLERLRAVLLYAGRKRPSDRTGTDGCAAGPRPVEAMITGLAALALHGFSSAPPLPSLDRIDVLVPRTRGLRSTGCARVVRAQSLPSPEEVTGLPVAPVPRALADAVGRLDDPLSARRLLVEAVRDGHCEAQAVVRALAGARLLGRVDLVDAVDALLAEGRAAAEGLLYATVRLHGLPDPCWNVELRLPGGTYLGPVDAYWPEEAVAVEIDPRDHLRADGDGGALWSECARRREDFERLGITFLHLSPRGLRDCPEQQAAVVRTALMAAPEREPAAYVLVLPR